MSLHDRIMALEIEEPIDFFDSGHNHGINRCAAEIKAADELMAEMAICLEDVFMLQIDQRSSKGGVEISELLQKYYNLSERTQ